MIKTERILHVCGIMNTGGTETLIMSLYRSIDRNKFQFDFIVHRKEKGFYDDEIYSLGGKIYYMPEYKVLNNSYYKKSWNTFFEEHPSYKVLHCHIRSTATIILDLAQKHNVKTILHCHSVSNGKSFSSLIKKIMQSSVKNKANINLACSKKAGEWLFGKNNFDVFTNSVNIEKFLFSFENRQTTRNNLMISDEAIVICQVGRFDNIKNQEFTLNVFHKLCKINKNCKLLFIGEGPKQLSIKKKAKKMNLENKVLFLGVRKDVGKILSACDIFLFPSKFEGLGISFVEAQVNGLVCIGSENIPNEAYISPNAIKIKGYFLNDWLEKILGYINNHTRIDSITIKSKAVARGFSVDERTTHLDSIYSKILNENE